MASGRILTSALPFGETGGFVRYHALSGKSKKGKGLTTHPKRKQARGLRARTRLSGIHRSDGGSKHRALPVLDRR
jgi:hypothetical protein